MEKEFLKVFDADERDVGEEGSLGEIVEGDVDFGNADSAGGFDDVDDAVDGADGAVEGEFADEELVFKVGGLDLVEEGEDGEGDGKVEIGAVF